MPKFNILPNWTVFSSRFSIAPFSSQILNAFFQFDFGGLVSRIGGSTGTPKASGRSFPGPICQLQHKPELPQHQRQVWNQAFQKIFGLTRIPACLHHFWIDVENFVKGLAKILELFQFVLKAGFFEYSLNDFLCVHKKWRCLCFVVV